MDKEINYIKKLFEDEKYMKELNRMYNQLSSTRRFSRRLYELENILSGYIAKEENGFVPDYMGFKNYALKNFASEYATSDVRPLYKGLVGNYQPEEIPDFLYYLAMLGHVHNDITEIDMKYEGSTKPIPRGVILKFSDLYSRFKLLLSLFTMLDRLVAVFINMIDTEDTEHLDDDIKNLDHVAIKHRFMIALQQRDKSMCFKLLGRMRELDDGEDYYFEAIAHYINKEYDEAVRYADKVARDDIDYSSAVALKLECYSLQGDIGSFNKCLDENKLKYNYFFFLYLLMTLLLRLDPENIPDGADDIEDITGKMQFDTSRDLYYMEQLSFLASDIVVEGLGILEEMDFVSKSYDRVYMSERIENRWNQLSWAIAVFPYDLNRFFDSEYVMQKKISELREEAVRELLPLIIDKNPNQTFEKIKKAFLCQLKLGDTEGFLDNISKNYDVLAKYSDNGETGADELFRLAYIEGTVMGRPDDRISARVEEAGDPDLTKDIDDKKIYGFLSDQGKLAYNAAEWQFIKSQEEDYGWKDAGMISLSFYRIIEVELNQKIVLPLLSGIGYKTLNEKYTDHVKNLSEEDRPLYEKKWGTVLNVYKEMEKNSSSGKGLMLGGLYHFFCSIGSKFEESDVLACLVRGKLGTVLNDYGISKFDEGFFENITNYRSIDKYRNPPAHTRYLPYETACECRGVFRETIKQLIEMTI